MSLSPERELEQFRQLDLLMIQLRQARDVTRAVGQTLRAAQQAFEADGCVAMAPPGEKPQVLVSIPRPGIDWPLDLMASFIREEHPSLPPGLMMAPIRRRGRSWAALALRRPPAFPFERDTFRRLTRFTTALSETIFRIDRDRMLEIRDGIDRKFMEQLRPQDLFYEILHGLRTLTRYDHSSALLIHDDGDDGYGLKLVAEQIAWVKGKSRRIGQTFTANDETRAIMKAGAVYGYERSGDDWYEWEKRPVAPLARLLDYNGDEAFDIREGSMLVAPLVTGDGLFGVLKIAARHPGAFSRHDAELVERFRSHAAMAIQNARRTENLHSRMVEAEKKHAMADLARGVSHDVNNALGSVLPIIQEMHEDVRAGRFDREVFAADLDQVQTSLQVCRRIFGGMLSFATRGARRTLEARVGQALEGPLAILQDGLDRRGVRLEIDVPGDLPPVAGGQSDLEQVFLNLITNAREAMPEGGRLFVSARPGRGTVTIEIGDTGRGIPSENLDRIQEPFFTTKPQGNGLGLSICRSIVWEMEGKMSFTSSAEGTTVRIVLPAVGGAGS